jgi:putative endonuclease
MTCPCDACRKAAERYSVYICRGRTGALYIGISTDPVRRLREHNGSKRGARWARSQRPLRLLWQEGKFTRSVALKFERKLKRLSRKQKFAFLRGDLPIEIPR